MRLGQLDRRVAILKPVVTDDGFTEDATGWAILCRRWSRVINGKGREAIEQQGIEAIIPKVFVLRHDRKAAKTTPRDRLIFDGRTYDIQAVSEIGRREGIEIIAAASDDVAPDLATLPVLP
jgi:head-tail adaptor